MIELQNVVNHNELLLGPTIFKVARVVHQIDSDSSVSNQAIREAVCEFSDKNPSYRVSGAFDIFEAFSDFLSFAHLQLSNVNIPGKSSLISSPTLRKLIEPRSEGGGFSKLVNSMYDLV